MRFSISIFIVALLFLTGCLNPFPKGTDVFYNRSYGSHSRNKLDIFLPETRDTSTETVVLIHGGAWVGGDKGGAELKEIRNHLLEAGYAVASMNYRYACGDYLKQMEDVDNALALIRNNAHDWIINDQRFGLMGFSAGGHLALLYGHAFDSENVVKTVISNVGPTDLTDSLFHVYASNYNIMWTLESLMGTTFESDSALYAEASPINVWSDCPSLFLYGALDDLVPAEQGIAMFDTLTANGVLADTIIPPLGTHNVYGPNNIYRSEVFVEIENWLNDRLNL